MGLLSDGTGCPLRSPDTLDLTQGSMPQRVDTVIGALGLGSDQAESSAMPTMTDPFQIAQ